MNPFSSQYDKARSNLAQINLSKSEMNAVKRPTYDMISSDYPTKKIRQEMLSDNPVYNDFNQPVSSSFPYRRTTPRESNLPETNYYSQPTQILESRYYDHVPMRETAEEENSRLREQNGILRSKLTAVMEDFQQLSALRHTEPEKALLDQEQIIQEINQNSKILNEKIQILEEVLGKLAEEDTSIPIKTDSKETPEIKAKMKKMLKQQNEITEKEKKLKQENMILRELTGLIVKETKTNNEGVQYVYNLSGRNGCSIRFFIVYSKSRESDIEFDRRQLNRFFWRLSSVLYEESNDNM
ncbi:hypothetical protein G6F37_002860 [Rhizopus arrhizus]|nr:hypothetical protein G6F38_003119 [Rhizopus arrhizus]KAG1161673.1 hypothetical protein G6F37_002860 [Rhizopus arrhizus]